MAINIFFIPLSTCINSLGETESRFLTPFGIIEVIYKAKKNGRLKSHFEVGMLGETDARIFFSQTFGEFKTAIQELWSETAQKFLIEDMAANYQRMTIHQVL